MPVVCTRETGSRASSLHSPPQARTDQALPKKSNEFKGHVCARTRHPKEGRLREIPTRDLHPFRGRPPPSSASKDPNIVSHKKGVQLCEAWFKRPLHAQGRGRGREGTTTPENKGEQILRDSTGLHRIACVPQPPPLLDHSAPKAPALTRTQDLSCKPP